jgi:hypothetical protein
MADEKDPRIITPIPKALLARIDDFRFEKRLPSRSEAIRQLIEAGLSKAQPAIPSGSNTPGATKKRAAGKRAPAPKAKPLPMSREAQIRALREQSVDEV